MYNNEFLKKFDIHRNVKLKKFPNIVVVFRLLQTKDEEIKDRIVTCYMQINKGMGVYVVPMFYF